MPPAETRGLPGLKVHQAKRTERQERQGRKESGDIPDPLAALGLTDTLVRKEIKANRVQQAQLGRKARQVQVRPERQDHKAFKAQPDPQKAARAQLDHKGLRVNPTGRRARPGHKAQVEPRVRPVCKDHKARLV